MGRLSSSGELVASLLYHSWRPDAPPLPITEGELATITPLLLGSGAGALAWARIRDSHLRETSSALELHEAYRLHALHASVFEDDISKLITLLRSAGVDPVLMKGWAIARLYSDTALRPYGDVDLCVRPSEYSAAVKVCESPEGQKFVVDLHDRFHRLDGLTVDELCERSQMLKLGDVEVRVPCAEDHLRILSLHFLRHGAWRPLWLCDIAVAIESRPADFDWDLCLGRSRHTRDWVACCIGLAHQLLGAEVEDTPIAHRAKHLPSWLISSVLKQWETPYAANQPPVTHRAPMAAYLHHPGGLIADLRRRWPNPIEATVYVGGSFNEFPRFPFQLGESLSRAAKFIARLPKDFRSDQSAGQLDTAKNRKQATHESDGKGLRAIAVFKLTKGLLLFAVGIGAIKLLHRDLSELATDWITAIRVDPDNRLFHGLITKLGLMTDRKLEELSIGSFFYSALLLTEGVGLWLKKRWAEYFTIITTCSLIPLELYEIEKRITVTRILLLVVNVAIVWYLIVQLRKNHK